MANCKMITKILVAIAAILFAASSYAQKLSDDSNKTVVVMLDSNSDRVRTGIDQWGDDCRMSVYMLTDSDGADACGYSCRIDENGKPLDDEPYEASLDDIYKSGMRVVDIDALLKDGQSLDDVQKVVRANTGNGKDTSFLLIDKAEISNGSAVVRPVGEVFVFPNTGSPR